MTSPVTNPKASLTVIVPAFNEEAYLPATLAAARRRVGASIEVIVVDNESTYHNEIALALGARVVSESIHNIGKGATAGARAALSDALVFVDADTSYRPRCCVRLPPAWIKPAVSAAQSPWTTGRSAVGAAAGPERMGVLGDRLQHEAGRRAVPPPERVRRDRRL